MGWWRDPHRPIIRTIGEKWKGGSYQIFFFAAYFSGVGWKRRHTSTSVRDIREGRVRSPDRSIVHELIGAADFRVLYTLSAPSERKKKKNLFFFFFSSQNSFFFQSPSSSFIAAIFPVQILKGKKKEHDSPYFCIRQRKHIYGGGGKIKFKKEKRKSRRPMVRCRTSLDDSLIKRTWCKMQETNFIGQRTGQTERQRTYVVLHIPRKR